MLNTHDNFVIGYIRSLVSQILDKGHTKIEIDILSRTNEKLNNNNKFIRHIKTHDLTYLYDNNKQIALDDEYPTFNTLEKQILSLLNFTCYYPSSTVQIRSSQNTINWQIGEIYESISNNDLDKLLEAEGAILPNYSCDDEDLYKCNIMYYDMESFINKNTITGLIDSYTYLCNETGISGIMRVYLTITDKTCHILENPYGDENGGGCVIFGKSKEYVRGFLNMSDVLCKLSIYCGHPDLWIKNNGWCHSHGESDFPNMDHTDKNGIIGSILEMTEKLHRYAMRYSKSESCDDESCDISEEVDHEIAPIIINSSTRESQTMINIIDDYVSSEVDKNKTLATFLLYLEFEINKILEHHDSMIIKINNDSIGVSQ